MERNDPVVHDLLEAQLYHLPSSSSCTDGVVSFTPQTRLIIIMIAAKVQLELTKLQRMRCKYDSIFVPKELILLESLLKSHFQNIFSVDHEEYLPEAIKLIVKTFFQLRLLSLMSLHRGRQCTLAELLSLTVNSESTTHKLLHHALALPKYDPIFPPSNEVICDIRQTRNLIFAAPTTESVGTPEPSLCAAEQYLHELDNIQLKQKTTYVHFLEAAPGDAFDWLLILYTKNQEPAFVFVKHEDLWPDCARSLHGEFHKAASHMDKVVKAVSNLRSPSKKKGLRAQLTKDNCVFVHMSPNRPVTSLCTQHNGLETVLLGAQDLQTFLSFGWWQYMSIVRAAMLKKDELKEPNVL